MNKILTLFKRGKNFGVINEPNYNGILKLQATEKIDGTNIRLTIRNENVVRVEARKNPTKQQKENGIINAWYRDADEVQDKHIFKSVTNRDYKGIPDGEYSAEAYGGKIQGNPLNCEPNVFIFSFEDERKLSVIDNFDYSFDTMKEWLSKQNSKFGDGKIEGVVLWANKPMYKIKTKDFRNTN